MAYNPETTKQAAASVALGFRVERTDLATVVWAAGPVSLFTITGGNILLNLLRAEVEVLALSADAGVPRYGITTAAPYAVATVYFSAAATTVASYGIGASVTVVGTALSTAAKSQDTIGPTLIGKAAPLILTPGIIIVTNAVPQTGGATSIIRHQMWYWPLDDGASVVAS
jgi:hypothetical protein